MGECFTAQEVIVYNVQGCSMYTDNNLTIFQEVLFSIWDAIDIITTDSKSGALLITICTSSSISFVFISFVKTHMVDGTRCYIMYVCSMAFVDG